jgi:hypothetical protein
LTFTPRLFGYGAHREDIEFVAEQVAGMVQNEIASCRFVKSASNVERERREREVGGNIFGTREAADAAGGE